MDRSIFLIVETGYSNTFILAFLRRPRRPLTLPIVVPSERHQSAMMKDACELIKASQWLRHYF